jgi:hypothetical protein
MLASAAVPKWSVTNVCSAVAAMPASRYQMRKRARPRASSTLLPKIQRNSMLPAMWTRPPCMNIDEKTVSTSSWCCWAAAVVHGPSTAHG